jgi:sugar phosphate permease
LPGTLPTFSRWRRRILVVAWLTYASFYLCRVNLAVAAPVMRAELGWDVGTVGLIGSAFLWVYALGQLVNGTLAQRADARSFVLVGMLVSAACNAAFGLMRAPRGASAPWAMAALWAVNGWAQSMGWGAIMKTIAAWVDPSRRGRIAALFSPCFVLGHLLSWTTGGWVAGRWGWPYAFWMPAAVFATMAVVWWWFIRSSPQSAGLVDPGDEVPRVAAPPPAFGDILRSLLRSPRLRWAALTCAFASMIKDGLNLWAPTLLVDGLGMRVDRAAWAASVLPLLGLAGSSLAGWSSDRFFRSRESPGIVGLSLLIVGAMLGLMAATGSGAPAGGAALPLVVLLLGVCGVAMYGINSLLLTSLPLSFANVAAVAGFLDAASYVGGGVSGLAAGQLLDGPGWGAVFAYWLAATAMAMVGGLALGRQSHSDMRGEGP